MALRIGKKKTDTPSAPDTVAPVTTHVASAPAADDWSDFASIPHETDADAVSDDWSSFGDMPDPSDDDDLQPMTSMPMASMPMTPTVVTPPDTPFADSPFDEPPVTPKRRGKKAIPKAALIAVPLILVGGGAAAFFLTQPSPGDSETTIDGPAMTPRKRPRPKTTAAPPKIVKASPTATKAAPTKNKTPLKLATAAPVAGKKPPVVKLAAKAVPAAKASPGLTRATPNLLDVERRASAAAMIIPDPPQSADPGVPADPDSVDFGPAVGSSGRAPQIALSPALASKRARLKALWNEGAAAKKRGDKSAARRVWQDGLKQAEASPRLDASAAGFRGSLAKLK